MLFIFPLAEIIMSAAVWRNVLSAWKCPYIFADGSDCCVVCPDRMMLARHMNVLHMMPFDESIRPVCLMSDIVVPLDASSMFNWDERSLGCSSSSSVIGDVSEDNDYDRVSSDGCSAADPDGSSSGISSVETDNNDESLLTLDETFANSNIVDGEIFNGSAMAVSSTVARDDEFFTEGRRIVSDILQTVRLARAPAPCRYCILQKTACFGCAYRMINSIIARCDDSPCGEFERQLMEVKLEELVNSSSSSSGPCVYCELGHVMCGSCWQSYIMSDDLE